MEAELLPRLMERYDFYSSCPIMFQAKASNNYLAIRNMSGHYFINGNWRVDFPGDYEVAGTTFKYEKKPKGKATTGKTAKLLSLFAPEHMTALGPTQEPIYLVVSFCKEPFLTIKDSWESLRLQSIVSCYFFKFDWFARLGFPNRSFGFWANFPFDSIRCLIKASFLSLYLGSELLPHISLPV